MGSTVWTRHRSDNLLSLKDYQENRTVAKPCSEPLGPSPQSHLDALQEALASGTLTVTFEGRSMTYRSVQELQRAISVVQSSLNQQSGKRVRQYRLSGSKGI